MEEIKLNLENLSDSERKQLMALVKKANKFESKAWQPLKGENYNFITSYGGIYCDCFNNGRSGDRERLALGNCFRTSKEAEEAVIRQQMLTKWKRLSIEAGEEENPWDGANAHWGVYYVVDQNNLNYISYYNTIMHNVFFPTKASCEAAVQELGEENVKKYILNIKE